MTFSVYVYDPACTPSQYIQRKIKWTFKRDSHEVHQSLESNDYTILPVSCRIWTHPAVHRHEGVYRDRQCLPSYGQPGGVQHPVSRCERKRIPSGQPPIIIIIIIIIVIIIIIIIITIIIVIIIIIFILRKVFTFLQIFMSAHHRLAMIYVKVMTPQTYFHPDIYPESPIWWNDTKWLFKLHETNKSSNHTFARYLGEVLILFITTFVGLCSFLSPMSTCHLAPTLWSAPPIPHMSHPATKPSWSASLFTNTNLCHTFKCTHQISYTRPWDHYF